MDPVLLHAHVNTTLALYGLHHGPGTGHGLVRGLVRGTQRTYGTLLLRVAPQPAQLVVLCFSPSRRRPEPGVEELGLAAVLGAARAVGPGADRRGSRKSGFSSICTIPPAPSLSSADSASHA